MSEFTVDPNAASDGEPKEPPMMKAILIGALVIAGSSFIPFVSFGCCLHMIVGGLLAVFIYSFGYDGAMPMSKGITIGLISTLMGGLLSVVVIDFIWLTFDHQVGAEASMATLMKLGEMLGPEASEQMMEKIEQAAEEGLTLNVLLTQLASTSFMSAIAGLISGSLGAAIFKGRG